jgi:hypothetical protein
MPTTSLSNRYSAVSSSSASSTSSNSCSSSNHSNHYHHQQQQQQQQQQQHQDNNSHALLQSSRSTSTFLPIRSAKSSFHLSKLTSANYCSMQSLRIQQQCRTALTPVARISPRIIHHRLASNETLLKQQEPIHQYDDGWLSCDELETIEKRFTDLLQEPTNQKSTIAIQEQQNSRAKSCDRLPVDDEVCNLTILSNKLQPDDNIPFGNGFPPRTSLLSHIDDNDNNDNDVENEQYNRTILPNVSIYDNNLRSRSQTPHKYTDDSHRTVLSANDILKVEFSYRSIGAQVFACRCLCDLYVTTAERLAKLEDWMLFQHGLPVWLLNSGTNLKRPSSFSLILAEHGSGFPIWQDSINEHSNIKQARAQYITFRLSDRTTLAVLRFHDVNACKEFSSYYRTIRNDHRYRQIFTSHLAHENHRSSSCGSMMKNRRKTYKNISKSSISNPCQFQHITSLQVKDRVRLISLDQCLLPSSTSCQQPR